LTGEGKGEGDESRAHPPLTPPLKGGENYRISTEPIIFTSFTDFYPTTLSVLHLIMEGKNEDGSKKYDKS
jgi:hypothetical protein